MRFALINHSTAVPVPPLSSMLTCTSAVIAPLARPCLLVLVLLVLLLSVQGEESSLPPVQHHVYYSGSHVSSITLSFDAGVTSGLYASDVVHNRVVHYDSSGSVLAVWNVTDPPLYSPTSIAHFDDESAAYRVLFVTDSTSARLVAVDAQHNGTQDTAFTFSLPSDMRESGLLLAVGDPEHALYVVDRYRGITARFQLSNQQLLWWTKPTPAPPGSTLTAAYLSALTAAVPQEGGLNNTLFLVDGTGDRVLQLDENGQYMEPPLFELPGDVKGILALDWTWCTPFEVFHYGCLWVMYQPHKAMGSERTVIAVLINTGRVVYNWTIAARQEADAATTSAGGGQQQQQAGQNAHLASTAMSVTGSGADTDPFYVHLAEADPSGPGHVIVVRDKDGLLVKRYESIPLQYDSTNATMHAFTAVQADSTNCTLWLTDVDNGGMLVQAAADGTILQHFPTPALFTSVVIDYSDSSLVSLVLLFANASEWQLWRFYPVNSTFTPLNTTSAQRQLNNSSRYNTSTAGNPAHTADVAGMAVGGLAVDSDTGRLLLSLPSADMVVMLDASGEWDDATFNIAQQVVHPSLAAFINTEQLVVVVDQSGEQGQWHFKAFDDTDGVLTNNVSFKSPMARPLALMYDRQSRSLWVSDVNGFIYQLDVQHFEVAPYRIFQPMPSAYSIRSLSMDVTGTLYAVDATTRRLILLFVSADRAVRPSSKAECTAATFPSSTGNSGPVPDSASGLSGLDAATVVMVYVVVASMMIGLVGRYYWQRRRRSNGGGADMELRGAEAEGAEPSAYERWNDVTGSVTWPRRREPVGRTAGTDADTFSGSGGQVAAIDASDSRYDAYVRLYEALNEAEGDMRKWHDTADPSSVHRGHSDDDNAPRSRATAAMWAGSLLHSSSTSTLSTPSSSTRSVGSAFHSSSDSSGSGSAGGSGNGSGQSTSRSVAAASPPSTIAFISSRVAPRFIDRVTDLRILGEGMSGRVYCGYYEGMRVVVKLPKSREMSAAQWREWQAHLRLPVHPNLVRFIGSLVMEDTNYLVLKWVEQGSLKSLLSSPAATRTARWYTRPYAVMRAAEDIANALAHVHQHNLTHRDVSARNVLVEADGTFVLADLGLCQEADVPTNSTPPVTPSTIPLRWCSPDYLSTMRHTDKADVWALGVTLWEMTSGGRLPYGDITNQRRLQQQLQSGLVKLRVDVAWRKRYQRTDERRPAGRVTTLIDECLAVDVERRPTAEQVVVMVRTEMAEWEATCAEEAQRVKQQWVDDHAAAARHTAAASALIAASDAAAEG